MLNRPEVLCRVLNAEDTARLVPSNAVGDGIVDRFA